MKRMRKLLVATVAAVVAMGSASAVLAQPIDYRYDRCVDIVMAQGLLQRSAEIACCAELGGSWVEIYDSKDNLIDEFCDLYEADEAAPEPNRPETGTIGSETTAGVQVPPVQTHVDDAIDGTIGTYEQMAPPAPTTGTTVDETSGTLTTVAASGSAQGESRVTR